MFYKLMYKRGMQQYKKSYFNILCIFILSLTMFSFTNIYNDSYLNYTDAILIPSITKDYTCDVRIINMTESQLDLFAHIPFVNVKYINGNLDFFLTDTDKFETVYQDIKAVHNQLKAEFHGDIENFPSIYTYYGKDGTEHVDDYHERRIETQLGMLLFQTILSVIGIAAMVLIYSNYIEERTEDIRTLSGIGISDRQLHKLFLGECNILYLISVVIGIPLGALIAFLYFKGCEFVDLSHSNSIYPVFYVDILSLLMTILLSYLVVYITFTIVLKKILRIDASYTCMETVMDFNPDKTRGFYYKADNRFYKFFSSIISKRSSIQFKIQTVLIIYSMIISIFMLNAVNYEFTAGINKYDVSAATIMESVANASLYIMIGVFSILYSLAVVWIFTKRHSESYKNTVQTLYAIGADESVIYYCFKRYTIGKIITSLISGFAFGYAVTIFIFRAGKYMFNINIWFLLGNLLVAIIYYAVSWISMKKYYRINCKNNIEV